MHKKPFYIRWIGFFFLVAVVAISFKVASFISGENIYIARGALGIAVIYFVLREANFTGGNQPLEVIYNFPKNLRFFAWAFGISIIFYWGFNEILQLLFWTIRTIASFPNGTH